jgi:hypothetical protein
MRNLVLASLCSFVVLGVAACSGGGPEGLARMLDSAIKAGDIDAELALLDTQGVPAQLQFIYEDLVNDCSEMTCVVSVAPLSPEFKERAAKQLKTQDLDFAVAPEGLIKVTGESADKKGHMSVEMPYAKVGGEYKIVSNTYTSAKIAELKAKSAQTLADELLANGVGVPPDKDWKSRARVLAAGGGEAGAALVAQNNAMTAAAKSNDPDAMVKALGQFGEIVYGDKDYQGKPIPLKHRQLKLRAQSVRFTYDTKVLSGYALDDDYALIYEGRDGAGWTVRGCEVGKLVDGHWKSVGSNTIEIPPG